jgi:hypothetical protein
MTGGEAVLLAVPVVGLIIAVLVLSTLLGDRR